MLKKEKNKREKEIFKLFIIFIIFFINTSILQSQSVKGIKGNEVVIDKGKAEGVKVGMEGYALLEWWIGGEKKHLKIALIKITKVYEDYSIGEIIEKTKEVQVGMAVQFKEPLKKEKEIPKAIEREKEKQLKKIEKEKELKAIEEELKKLEKEKELKKLEKEKEKEILNDPLEIIKRAEKALKEDKLDEAKKYYNKLNEILPGNPDTQEGIRKINERMEEIKKEEEKRANKEKAKGFINMGDLSFEKKEYEKALSYYQIAMQIAPEDVQIKQKISKTLDIINNVIKTFEGHTATVSSVAFSPDGKLALSGSFDNTLKLWYISERYLK